MSHHYAFVAAKLLNQCLEQIQGVIDMDEHSNRPHPSNSTFYDIKEALAEAERQLFRYFSFIIQKEVENSLSTQVQEIFEKDDPCFDLPSCVDFLHFVLRESSLAASNHAAHPTHSFYPRRSATDSLLFRLHVALQLCMVRIDDSRLAICGRSYREATAVAKTHAPSLFDMAIGMLGVTTVSVLYVQRSFNLKSSRSLAVYQPFFRNVAKTGVSLIVARWLHQKWSNLWMTAKLVKSIEEIEEWSRQWTLVQCTPAPRPPYKKVPSPSLATDKSNETLLNAAQSRRLIEYALHETTKTSFWHSQGELRFLMLKRAMDVLYASVGTAMDLTKRGESGSEESDAANWRLTLVTAAVASYYSVTGARDRAVAVTSSFESASNLIQNAWGMVSLPAVKNLSLQASRLLKGAAVADRIEICGVHCFVLSSDPAPEVAAAIKRNRRLHQRRKPIATLCTIDEQEEHTPSTLRNAKPFARSSSRRYRQRDVIFHLTGGGFFAHIIASDLPYLLDWSAATGAVVICPEYALLPEHTFPVALHQIVEVYQSLVSDEAVSVLGFETNRIVVTGESAGGNLAASLCVMLSMDRAGLPMNLLEDDNGAIKTNSDNNVEVAVEIETTSSVIRLPDALMLSCPVLDLSLELSHSRVVGTEDPVLPSGLISAISDAYLPVKLGIRKKDPLASPFYASDAVLRQFPPTLLFASSTDPLLDDCVVFNQRLRNHNVESDLVAAHNLPHAYLGLGTAGFPEALQVQEQCVNWLTFQLSRDGGS